MDDIAYGIFNGVQVGRYAFEQGIFGQAFHIEAQRSQRSAQAMGQVCGGFSFGITDTKTFSLIGGTASVSCSGSQITLNWATPKSSFQVETGTSNGGAQVEVRFRSDTHESRLEAWCAGGHVQSSVREESV